MVEDKNDIINYCVCNKMIPNFMFYFEENPLESYIKSFHNLFFHSKDPIKYKKIPTEVKILCKNGKKMAFNMKRKILFYATNSYREFQTFIIMKPLEFEVKSLMLNAAKRNSEAIY